MHFLAIVTLRMAYVVRNIEGSTEVQILNRTVETGRKIIASIFLELL
jgi:hypothetical protein